jgi:hypothetical protein
VLGGTLCGESFCFTLFGTDRAATNTGSGDEALSGAPMAQLTQVKDYVLKRASSYDRTGSNAATGPSLPVKP